VRDGRAETPGLRSTAVSDGEAGLKPDAAAYLTLVVSLLPSRTWTGSRCRDACSGFCDVAAERSPEVL